MNKKVLIKGEALQASVVSALAAEQFLTQNYIFRRNQLNGKVEFATMPSAAPASAPVFPRPPEPLEQVRQGDGIDEQPDSVSRRVGGHPPQPACLAEADALEKQSERTPHLRLNGDGLLPQT